MGRRKSKRKPARKNLHIKAIPKRFRCPFCSILESCKVTINKVREKGTIKCCRCQEAFEMETHNLTQAVDVYNAWIDACDVANKELQESTN